MTTISLEKLIEIAKNYKPMRVKPMQDSMESFKYDAHIMTKLKTYKLLYGKEAAEKLITAECKNRVYESKISACEYYIEELLEEVKKYSDNHKLIDNTEIFLTGIEDL